MRRFLLIVGIVLCQSQVWAQTLYVPSEEYSSIQSAIDDADNGETIIVSPGTYYENLNFLGKLITVRSVEPNDPDVVADTIIDGSYPVDPNIASVVTFVSGEDASSVLSGFTIENGTGQSDPCGASWYWKGTNGGGVFCRQSSPAITKNVFKNCNVGYGGGAIYCHDQASPMITDNIFIGNYADDYGGAIFARLKCSPTISNNIFQQNQCRFLGGAVYLADRCYSKVTNNRFEQNNCEMLFGGAIYYFVNCAPVVANNFFIGNTCSGRDGNGATGAAILMEGGTTGKIINNVFTGNYCENLNGVTIKIGNGTADLFANNIVYENDDVGIDCASEANPVILNNDVWGNVGGNYGGGIGDQTGINGNISANPQVSLELPKPFTSFELHPNSPCIDAGSSGSLPSWLTQDYDGTERVVNGVVDMGPQEYHFIAVPYDFDTIQEAINAAESGRQIVVLPGFYQENIDFLDKNIRLRSVNPLEPNCVDQTIIDGNNLDSCIKILCGQNQSTAVAGLRIQNGLGQFGGGIYVSDSVGPLLMHNYIINNQAIKPQGSTTGGYGGGIDCRYDSYAEVINNTIVGNFATHAGGGIHIGPRSSCLIRDNQIIENRTTGEGGGGIYSFDKTTAWIIDNLISANKAENANGAGIWQWRSLGGVIQGNIIVDNIATLTPGGGGGGGGRGGGIGILDGATAVNNNIVSGNRAYEGGGIWIQSGGTCEVVNNTLLGNTANYGGGIGVAYSVTSPIVNNIIACNSTWGGIYVKPHPAFPSEPNLIANDLWDNDGGNYVGDINDLTGVKGNISADPCFVEPGYWDPNGTPADANDDYWLHGDYHIIQHFSPCWDAGSDTEAPNDDIEGDPRPSFGSVDIGADEVSVYDYSGLLILTNSWLIEDPSSLVDVYKDDDDIINFRDFAVIALDWSD